jgi:glycerol-3-phosphate acyltransferase PlsX
MGGDHAPREVVRGAVLAAQEMHDVDLHLVGVEDDVRRELEGAGWAGDSIQLVPAADVIGMGESPVEALRKKRDSSIARALALVRSGRASSFVSAGNTGACVAAATLCLRALPEVKKAGIAVAFHVGAKPVVLLDAGANVEARPEHLFQYGVMAALYATEILGVENPRVGLLNIGEEGAKGNRLAKETHDLFRRSGLNFYGNIEGVEVFQGRCDVVICDGFTGNIVLKVSEGIAERLVGMFQQALQDAFVGALDGVAARGVRERIDSAMASLQERLDYAEFGGAPLLGVNGTVIIAHGRSHARAVFNAIRVAKRMADVDINGRIVENIRRLGRLADEGERDPEVLPENGASREGVSKSG